MLLLENLIELGGYIFAPMNASHSLANSPTTDSIDRISRELGITVPRDLITFATQCPGYSSWFGRIGEDYEHPYHILSLNQAHRNEGLPAYFVLLNHGYDGDCDCWDVRELTEKGEHPIVYHSIGNLAATRSDRRYSSFRDYLENYCRLGVSRIPDRELRRKAKRRLAALELEQTIE